MGNDRTPEEARQHYIDKMGEPLGKLFYALWQEVAWLYAKWDEYVELYGTKPSRIEILNKAAPTFFRIVQDALWEETLLHIARLTDAPRSAGKENLTIKQLPVFISDPDTAQKVSEQIDIAIESSAFCRDWRNRRIAHSDLRLAIEEGITPLDPASRKQVTQALESIAGVLNVVTQHYMGSTTFFDVGGANGGAIQLLSVLQIGLKGRAERLDRLQRGEYCEDDFRSHDL